MGAQAEPDNVRGGRQIHLEELVYQAEEGGDLLAHESRVHRRLHVVGVGRAGAPVHADHVHVLLHDGEERVVAYPVVYTVLSTYATHSKEDSGVQAHSIGLLRVAIPLSIEVCIWPWEYQMKTFLFLG